MHNVCYMILTLQHTYETPTMIKHSTYLHTTLIKLKDNSVPNKRALELVIEESHLERIKLSETAQKKRIERRTTEKRKNTERIEEIQTMTTTYDTHVFFHCT